ncbi:hypothetical protein VZT92_000038 [Zoarces viviparus]|uniref:Uncharacterized protein n=1 Tax=Zoarces viviparus TaxID=48416 RepID=A0AAW1G5Q7_ZOAVI
MKHLSGGLSAHVTAVQPADGTDQERTWRRQQQPLSAAHQRGMKRGPAAGNRNQRRNQLLQLFLNFKAELRLQLSA